MIRSVTILTLIMLQLSARFASADFFDDCVKDCSTVRTQCVEGITLYDATGVQEAKAVCNNELAECGKKCHVQDADGYDEAARARQEAEDAEKKRQDTVNGGIKTFNFDK